MNSITKLLATMVATSVPASAATFAVTGGVTSVDLDDALLATIGWSVTGATGTVAPAAGFDVGFSILSTSDFSYEDSPFAINGGSILHSGTVTLTSNGASVPAGSIIVGNFTITSMLEIVDTVTTGVALFTAGNVAPDVSTPGTLIVTGDLLITDALSNALVGNSSLTGADAGDFRVAGVPEPGIATLAGLAALALVQRRRRV